MGPRVAISRAWPIARTVGAGLIIAWSVSTVLAHGGDAHAYWAASQADPYGRAVDDRDAYLYSPVFLQLLWPVQQLPWEAFRALFLAGQVAALLWLVGPVLTALFMLPTFYSPVYTDLYFGNVNVFLATAAVAGFRWPPSWSFLALTKLTPGVAMLWYAVRRDWRGLASSAGATILLVAVSFAIAPRLWEEWVHLLQSSGPGTTLLRTAVGGVLVVVGAARSWRWTVVGAVLISQPVLWYASFTILLGWFWLLRDRGRRTMPAGTPGKPESSAAPA